MKLEKREAYKWAKYRWECMRRNPEAMRIVFKALGKDGPIKFFKRHRRGKGPVNALIGEDRSERLSSDFYSPDLSFDEIVDKIRKRDPGVIGEMLAYSLINSDYAVNYEQNGAKLKIEIDLDEVCSVESLKRMISEIIDTCYSVAVKLKDITPKKRPNMADFDLILKVGDMKRQGKKNREIAQAIHPRKFAENPESAIRLICYYNVRYKDLVCGNGFFDLTYP